MTHIHAFPATAMHPMRFSQSWRKHSINSTAVPANDCPQAIQDKVDFTVFFRNLFPQNTDNTYEWGRK